MKIVEVHTHMSVQFGPRKREERFFNVENVKKFENLSLELIEGLGVRISNHEDSLIVPLVNIIAIRTEQPAAPQMTDAERSVLGMQDSDESETEEQGAEEQDSTEEPETEQPRFRLD